GTVDADRADLERAAPPHHAQHAAEVEDYAESISGEECITDEWLVPHDFQPLEAQRRMRKAAEQAEARVLPGDLRVHAPHDRRTDVLLDPATEHQRQQDEQQENGRDDGGRSRGNLLGPSPCTDVQLVGESGNARGFPAPKQVPARVPQLESGPRDWRFPSRRMTFPTIR